MKRRKLAFLCGMACLFLIACGKGNAQTIPNEKAKEKQPQSSHTKEEDSSDKGETPKIGTAGEDSSHMEPWEQAYLDYLDRKSVV